MLRVTTYLYNNNNNNKSLCHALDLSGLNQNTRLEGFTRSTPCNYDSTTATHSNPLCTDPYDNVRHCMAMASDNGKSRRIDFQTEWALRR